MYINFTNTLIIQKEAIIAFAKDHVIAIWVCTVFLDNGEILGFMSESLVYEHDNIKEIDMNEFMHDFVKPLIKENLLLKSKLDEKSSELKDAEEEYDRIFSIWHNRKLIKKFDDEYDKEDKKENPNRNYAYVMPDAEEVYKRYYKLKDKIEDLQKKNAYFEKCLSEIANENKNLKDKINRGEK